jgi:hypothetical protein
MNSLAETLLHKINLGRPDAACSAWAPWDCRSRLSSLDRG